MGLDAIYYFFRKPYLVLVYRVRTLITGMTFYIYIIILLNLKNFHIFV